MKFKKLLLAVIFINAFFSQYSYAATPNIPLKFSNTTQKLSDYKGKLVYLDFWASWCGPCRKENPNVVQAFNKFKSYNFTILGVSLDKDKEKWAKAIEKDQLNWTHISDLSGWSNAVAQQFGVKSIPFSILIDPEGIIMAKNLRGEELQEFLKNELT